MKFTHEMTTFMQFTNQYPGETWNLTLMQWPKAPWQVQWRCRDQFLLLDHLEARNMARHMRCHFKARFMTVAPADKLPEIEKQCFAWCDHFEALAKQALHHNRTLGKVAA